jgi:hypothetical protein
MNTTNTPLKQKKQQQQYKPYQKEDSMVFYRLPKIQGVVVFCSRLPWLLVKAVDCCLWGVLTLLGGPLFHSEKKRVLKPALCTLRPILGRIFSTLFQTWLNSSLDFASRTTGGSTTKKTVKTYAMERKGVARMPKRRRLATPQRQ